MSNGEKILGKQESWEFILDWGTNIGTPETSVCVCGGGGLGLKLWKNYQLNFFLYLQIVKVFSADELSFVSLFRLAQRVATWCCLKLRMVH
jgi:hypothetical protein